MVVVAETILDIERFYIFHRCCEYRIKLCFEAFQIFKCNKLFYNCIRHAVVVTAGYSFAVIKCVNDVDIVVVHTFHAVIVKIICDCAVDVAHHTDFVKICEHHILIRVISVSYTA